MQRGELQPGLVNATPVLQGVIDQAAGSERVTDTDVVTKVHTVMADVAIKAYKAGVAATVAASRFYDSPEYAAARLTFRADLAALDLHDRDRLTTHSSEVTALLDTTPSFISFDATKCTPENGFTDKHREAWSSITEDLVANFKLCDDTAWAAIAAEMGYVYGRQLQMEGIDGQDLLNRVRAFEVKQTMIIRASVTSGELRQPDQDDHAFEHYLEDLSRACMPVWKILTAR